MMVLYCAIRKSWVEHSGFVLTGPLFFPKLTKLSGTVSFCVLGGLGILIKGLVKLGEDTLQNLR